MALGLYRVAVLCRAALPFPHPTDEDYAYIKEAYEAGAQPEDAAKVLRRRHVKLVAPNRRSREPEMD